MKKHIRITEIGNEDDEHYYSLIARIPKDRPKCVEFLIGGLNGIFRLYPSQRKKLAKFLLQGLKKK